MWQIYTLIAVFLYGISSIVSKHVLKNMKTEVFVIILNLSGAFCYLFFYEQFTQPTNNIGWLLLILNCAVWTYTVYLMYEVYKHLDLSLIAPLSNIYPGIVLLLSFLFLNEALTLNKVIGVLIIIIGAVILSYKVRRKYKITRTGMRLMITYLILYSVIRILDKATIIYFNPGFYGFLLFLIPGLLLTLNYARKEKRAKVTGKNLLLSILLGFLGFLGYYFVLLAYQLTEVSRITPLLQLNIIIAMIGGFFFYKEKGLLRKSIGALIVLIGAILII